MLKKRLKKRQHSCETYPLNIKCTDTNNKKKENSTLGRNHSQRRTIFALHNILLTLVTLERIINSPSDLSMLEHWRQTSNRKCIIIVLSLCILPSYLYGLKYCLHKLYMLKAIYLQCLSVNILVSGRKSRKVVIDTNHALNFTL